MPCPYAYVSAQAAGIFRGEEARTGQSFSSSPAIRRTPKPVGVSFA